MSESDTMFNEWDRRCAAVQLMLSTDPSYDNRTIASTLKIQIRTVQHVQGDENKISSYGYGLWCGFKWGPHHATSHFRSRLESQHQSVPGCAEESGDPLVQQVASGRPWVWQQDSAPAHKSKETQAWFRRNTTTLYPSITGPLLPWPEPAGLLCLVIRREHNQHDLPQHQSQPDRRVFTELPPTLVEKACSQFRIRIEAVIEAEGG